MTKEQKMAHVHSFTVGAACECGLMISEVMRDLQQEIERLKVDIGKLQLTMAGKDVKIERLKGMLGRLEEQHEKTCQRAQQTSECLEMLLDGLGAMRWPKAEEDAAQRDCAPGLVEIDADTKLNTEE